MDMTRHYHDLYGEESKDQKIKRLYAQIERLQKEIELLHIRIDYYMKVLALRDDIQQKDTE